MFQERLFNDNQGTVSVMLAYGSWGLLPLYWKLFLEVPALEVLVLRILWSVVFLLLVLTVKHKLPLLVELCRNPSQVLLLSATSYSLEPTG